MENQPLQPNCQKSGVGTKSGGIDAACEFSTKMLRNLERAGFDTGLFRCVVRQITMDSTRQQSLGAIIIALSLALGQLPSLVPVVTEPAVSIFDRTFVILMLVGALSLFTLGISRLRNPEQFDDGSTEQEFRSIPVFIIAIGLVGIGALMFLIVS